MTQAAFLDRERVYYIGKEAVAYGTQAATMRRLHALQTSDIVAGLAREVLVNDTSAVRRDDNPSRVLGLQRGAPGALSVLLKGCKSANRLDPGGTAAGQSQRIMLEHGFGREYAQLGCTVGSSSTTTSIVVDDSSARKPGELVLIETASASGIFNAATIVAVPDGTHITIAQGLAAAPTSGARVRACHTYVPAETRSTALSLEQAQVGQGVTGREYRVLGAFGSLALAFPDRFGQLIQASLSFAGYQSSTGPSSLSLTTTPADDDMDVPFIWTPAVWLDSTIERASDSAYVLERLGVEMMGAPDPIVNPNKAGAVGGFIDTAGREGGIAYRVTAQVQCDPAEISAFTAQTMRRMLVQVTSDGGSILVLDFPRLELIEQPQPVALGAGRRGLSLVFGARRDTTCTLSGSTAEDTDMGYAPFRLGIG